MQSSESSERIRNREVSVRWQYSREEIPKPERLREEHITSSQHQLWSSARTAAHTSFRIMLAQAVVKQAAKLKQLQKQRPDNQVKETVPREWSFFMPETGMRHLCMIAGNMHQRAQIISLMVHISPSANIFILTFP